MRYLAWIATMAPVSQARGRVRALSSCVCERYSVENQLRVLRAVAFLTETGSR